MNTDIDAITEKIIGCAYRVSNSLGSGFLEKIYENSLVIELKKNRLLVNQQKPIVVRYDGQVVGEYIADMLVENIVIVELKAVKSLDEVHMAQCLNYLKAADLRICLLINFGRPKIQIQRIVNGL